MIAITATSLSWIPWIYKCIKPNQLSSFPQILSSISSTKPKLLLQELEFGVTPFLAAKYKNPIQNMGKLCSEIYTFSGGTGPEQRLAPGQWLHRNINRDLQAVPAMDLKESEETKSWRHF